MIIFSFFELGNIVDYVIQLSRLWNYYAIKTNCEMTELNFSIGKSNDQTTELYDWVDNSI